jgi:hypothetical protein
VIKAFFVVIEIALAIAFGVCGWHQPHNRNAAAVLEWGMYPCSPVRNMSR